MYDDEIPIFKPLPRCRSLVSVYKNERRNIRKISEPGGKI